jgi:hypothetical protein
MSNIKWGDKVRVKARKDWPFPPMYQLTDTEGIVTKVWESLDVMEEFQEYVNVRIEKTNADFKIGSSLIFRVENLERI